MPPMSLVKRPLPDVLRLLALVVWLPLTEAALAAEPAPLVRDEVRHLLAYLGEAPCEFFRNGEWHSAAAARDHLTKKYDYLVRKDLVSKSEDFIRLGATKSSVSGKPYQVRCNGSQPVPSDAWLGEELARYRGRMRSKRQ